MRPLEDHDTRRIPQRPSNQTEPHRVNNLLTTALTMHHAGLTVVPLAVDGTKRPSVPWKRYQHERPSEYDIKAWFDPRCDVDGLGVLTGTASGGLVMLEAEGRAVAAGLVTELAALMTDSGLGDLWDRLCTGWMEYTPSGGMHWHARIVDEHGHPADVGGNTKLARRPGEIAHTVDVLFETRGEGGFTVTAPSAGRSHPTGQPWRLLAGGPATVPTLTLEEYDAIKVAMSTFDAMPAPTVAYTHISPAGRDINPGALRPGDDYNQRATWDDILGSRGWAKASWSLAGRQPWVRPGKQLRDGISATTGGDTDLLYVFTTSTEFEPEKPYDKLGAIALLEYGGDIAAAARDLRSKGYGSPADVPLEQLGLDGQKPARHLHAVDNTPTPTPPAAGVPQPVLATTPVTVGANALQLAVADEHHLDHAPAADTATETTVRDSEDAHAHRLIATFGDLLRYCPERGLWLAWDGARWLWQPKGGGIAREYAKRVARSLTDTDAALTQRRRALSSIGITGCLKMAETDPRITVSMGQLDTDPWILNTPAGQVDLRTGNLHTPDPTTLCTKTTTVAPLPPGTPADPDGVWAKFLDDTFGTTPDGIELRDYVQRFVGMTLVGQVRDQKMAFLHGPGANGKSTLTKILMRILGVGENGYAIAAAAEMLMVRKHQEHPAEIAKLAGARMVVCSELDDSQRFNEARIKDLTGGDLMDARFLYGQPFTFTPTHTMWLYGNKQPAVTAGGPALWRRLALIELKHVVPPALRDPALDDKLYAAGSTVLSWAIAGAVNYLTGGLAEPAAVAQATAAYAADQDTIGRFIDSSCHRADSDLVRVPKGKLYDAYSAWCRETGDEPATGKRFGQELRQRFNVDDLKSNGRQFYTRITLLDDDNDTLGWSK